jgi:hypothetical protein
VFYLAKIAGVYRQPNYFGREKKNERTNDLTPDSFGKFLGFLLLLGRRKLGCTRNGWERMRSAPYPLPHMPVEKQNKNNSLFSTLYHDEVKQEWRIKTNGILPMRRVAINR